jgi:hypothetical protein
MMNITDREVQCGKLGNRAKDLAELNVLIMWKVSGIMEK